jgi:hypothetical protein
MNELEEKIRAAVETCRDVDKDTVYLTELSVSKG